MRCPGLANAGMRNADRQFSPPSGNNGPNVLRQPFRPTQSADAKPGCDLHGQSHAYGSDAGFIRHDFLAAAHAFAFR
ncbi:hypothetical protein AA16663_0300 [Komagataeibacter rhaeticus DSM 16663]|nr:hypothetical protein AA16663_0300 [Komagataeibacter rhaeticus DSM 16663]